MKYTPLFFAVLLFACNTPSKQREKIIRVSGEGKIRIKPDLVILTIEVSFTKPRMADAVKLTEETIDSVSGILQKFARTNDDIKTSSISADKDYNYSHNQQVFIGYQAKESIDFVLRDIQKFTALTGKLLETRMSSISQIQFGHSRADSLFREANLLAYDDALQSAGKLCARANASLGELISVTNTEAENNAAVENNYSNEGINTFAKSYGGRGFKISPEVLEFRRTLITEYEIIH
jgi:uncharacterized protein YggE